MPCFQVSSKCFGTHGSTRGACSCDSVVYVDLQCLQPVVRVHACSVHRSTSTVLIVISVLSALPRTSAARVVRQLRTRTCTRMHAICMRTAYWHARVHRRWARPCRKYMTYGSQLVSKVHMALNIRLVTNHCASKLLASFALPKPDEVCVFTCIYTRQVRFPFGLALVLSLSCDRLPRSLAQSQKISSSCQNRYHHLPWEAHGFRIAMRM